MALRLAYKINSNIIQNFGKYFYKGKIESITTTAARVHELPMNSAKEEDPRKTLTPPPRILLAQKSSEDTELEISQKKVQIHHLQPSLLPEYYKTPLDVNAGTYPKPPENEQPKSMGEYRHFEKSKTYKSVKLPLKQPKLSSPFPEPVKVMQSDTMTDMDKADQKTAESRSSFDNHTISTKGFSQTRSYSTVGTDDKKCGKKKPSKKKTCPDIKGSCNPATEKHCDRLYPFKKCCKKNAPYPAYSELCHTVPYEPPSECKMCPWKPNEHPSFKPPKKKFHTSAATFCPKKRYLERRWTKIQRSKEWIDENEWVKNSPEATKNDPAGMCLDECDPCKRHRTSDAGNTISNNDHNPGQRPKIRGKLDKSRIKSGKSQAGGKRRKNKKPKKRTNANRSWTSLVDSEELSYLANAKKDGKNIKGEGKKTKCEKPTTDSISKCPIATKFQRKNIKKEKEKCKKKFGPMEITSISINQYLLGGKKEEGGKGGPKCPKVKVGVCKEEEEDDDPCGSKSKGITRKCPGDLLIKRRRDPRVRPKDKKTSSVHSPAINQPSTSSQPTL